MNHKIFKRFWSGTAILLLAGLSACSDSKLNQAGKYRLAGIASESDAQAKAVRVSDTPRGKAFEYLPTDADELSEKGWLPLGQLKVVKAGSQFYHWGATKDIRYSATQGIDAAGVDSDVKKVNMDFRMGSGYYMSSSIVDSADYGPNVLVIQPKHDILILDVSRNTDGFFDTSKRAFVMNSGTEVPLDWIVDQGIDALQYTETWYVCINGRVVENVFEGTWKNFADHFGDLGIKSPEFQVFASKYPLTADVLDDPEFISKFPDLKKDTVRRPTRLSRLFLGNTAYELRYASYPANGDPKKATDLHYFNFGDEMSYPQYASYGQANTYNQYASYPASGPTPDSLPPLIKHLKMRAASVCRILGYKEVNYVITDSRPEKLGVEPELLTIDSDGNIEYSGYVTETTKSGKFLPTFIERLGCAH